MAWRIVGSVKHHIEVTAAEHFKEVGLPMKQYVISREDFLRLMDELWELGARGILSTDIHACRL